MSALRVVAFASIGLYLFSSGAVAAPVSAEDLASVQQQRLADPIVREVLRGALLFLDDTQVRDRPGRRSSYFDWCGDYVAVEQRPRCRPRIFVTRPLSPRLLAVPVPGIDIHNEIGEWGALIGVVPDGPDNRRGRFFAGVQDSTMFVTAAVGYPLFLFDAPADGVIAHMLALANDNIARYRRGDAYNFWLQHPAVSGSGEPYMTVFPTNIPIEFLAEYARRYVERPQRFRAFTGRLTQDQRDRLLAWVRTLLDRNINPHGAESAVNVPDDVDDTSAAVTFGALYRSRRLPHTGHVIDENALSRFARFRDLNRSREDFVDTWKGTDTGAFLTWLKDENAPTFAHPETGIVVRAVNNVDCVVNANALLALALTGRTTTPGYRDALRLMVRAVETRAWPQCGIYYVQRMIFPYALSRAWRDGGATSPALDAALGTLMRDVLAQQSPDGWFDGGLDRSRDLSTALAVVSLLNLGERTASASGIPVADYRRAIEAGLTYLYRHRHRVSVKNADTFARQRPGGPWRKTALNWRPGIFFTPAFRLAEWRSEAYATAIVLEAFARYALAYDMHSAGIRDGPRIAVDETRLDFRIKTAANRP